MPLWNPPDHEIARIEKRCADAAGIDEAMEDNLLFSAFFNETKGLFPRSPRKAVWVNGVRYRKYLSRRQWLERYFSIKPKGAPICLYKANPSQRKLECSVLRMERARVPVRVIILKARRQGFSTCVEGMAVERLARGENLRGKVIAHTADAAEIIIRIAHTARDYMPKNAGERFKFKMASKATDSLAWADPIRSRLDVSSAAEGKGAGRGDTLDFLHITETAFWPDARDLAVGVLEALDDVPGTYGFNESTANGDAGWFRDEFHHAWDERKVPFILRKTSWNALFFAWWEHPDYRWSKTYGSGRTLPKELHDEIADTLDEEEKWLLRQRYLQRWSSEDEWEQVDRALPNGATVKVHRRKGVGWREVDFDQLAWRRKKIAALKGKGGINIFNQEYPSRPEVAFLATGERVFDPNILAEYSKRTREPEHVGDAVETNEPILALDERGVPMDVLLSKAGPVKFKASREGTLRIWTSPQPGRQYVMGVDCAGTSADSDMAVAAIIDAETTDLVAMCVMREDPIPWGRRVARIGWYYNEALLAIEAFPSAHGMAAMHEAIRVGYRKVYHRQILDTATRQMTPKLGWYTTVASKALMIARMKEALQGETDIPSEAVLAELRSQRWDASRKMTSDGHDDMFDALSIAYCVRDDAWSRNELRPAKLAPPTADERVWNEIRDSELRSPQEPRMVC